MIKNIDSNHGRRGRPGTRATAQSTSKPTRRPCPESTEHGKPQAVRAKPRRSGKAGDGREGVEDRKQAGPAGRGRGEKMPSYTPQGTAAPERAQGSLLTDHIRGNFILSIWRRMWYLRDKRCPL